MRNKSIYLLFVLLLENRTPSMGEEIDPELRVTPNANSETYQFEFTIKTLLSIKHSFRRDLQNADLTSDWNLTIVKTQALINNLEEKVQFYFVNNASRGPAKADVIFLDWVETETSQLPFRVNLKCMKNTQFVGKSENPTLRFYFSNHPGFFSDKYRKIWNDFGLCYITHLFPKPN